MIAPQPGIPSPASGRIRAIKKRAEKATEGPWCWEFTGEKSNDYAIGVAYGPNDQRIEGRLTTSDDPESGVWMEDAVIRKCLLGESDGGTVADAEFIAHAREDIPYLLAEIDRLTAVREPAGDPVDTAPNVTVTGRLARTLDDFERACLVHLDDEQQRANPDNALIAVLCDAVRLKREHVEALRGTAPGERPTEQGD